MLVSAGWFGSAWTMACLARVPITITRMMRIPTRLVVTSRNESWPGASAWDGLFVAWAVSLWPLDDQTAVSQQGLQFAKRGSAPGSMRTPQHRFPVAPGDGDPPVFDVRPDGGDELLDGAPHGPVESRDMRFGRVRRGPAESRSDRRRGPR